MHEKILEFLKKKQEYISGDYIAGKLKITRQALWKHIQELRESGYDIAAVPHLGYKLVSCPDRVFVDEIISGLNTRFLGKKIHYFDTVGSTMDISQDMAVKNSPEGTVVVAETQTKGRGRLKREWHSPKYKGLYLSLILRPRISPVLTPVLTLLSAVSICEAIKEVLDIDARIKWPNDILIGNKKVGGILTELNAEPDLVHFVVIGIGLNVNNDKNTLPSGAVSLKECKKEEACPVREPHKTQMSLSNGVNRVVLLQEILLKLEENYIAFLHKGNAQIIEKWRNHSATLGTRIKIMRGNKHFEGEAVDIDENGALLVRRDHGFIEKVTAGDVFHCR